VKLEFRKAQKAKMFFCEDRMFINFKFIKNR